MYFTRQIKTTASLNKKIAKSFVLLNSLEKELTIGSGIINQYPNKHYRAEDLVTLSVSYL